MRVTLSALDKQAMKIADEISEDVTIPEPTVDPREYTGYTNSVGEPTLYPEELYPEGKPVEAKAKAARSHSVTRRKAVRVLAGGIAEIPEKALETYNGQLYAEMISRNDGPWEYFTGWNKEEQDHIDLTRSISDGYRAKFKNDYGHDPVKSRFGRVVCSSDPIVMEHLDTRPIICYSEDQAKIEARRLGKEINATGRINEGK